LDDIIAHRPLEEDEKYSEWLFALHSAAQLNRTRFFWYPNLEDLEDAMSRIRTSLNYSSPGDKVRSTFTKHLAELVEERTKGIPRELLSLLRNNSPIHYSNLWAPPRRALWGGTKHGMFERLVPQR
jgi:hypothetical protein